MEWVQERAQEVLAQVPDWIWDGESLPVPIEDIVDSCYSLRVCEVEDLRHAPGAPPTVGGQALSGLLLPSRREIWVNAEEAQRWPPRKRFTVCHELGHWCMHRDQGAVETPVFCRSTSVEPDPGAMPSEIEAEAQQFAAALLIPARSLRECYARDSDFNRLCDRFGASGAAMSRRVRQVI